jgi:hypothetical protein
MKNGGWTLAKPNTISMPLPILAPIASTIGGITYWAISGVNLPRTLGDGTFLVCNMVYSDIGGFFGGSYVAYGIAAGDGGPLFEYSIKQGVGLTYPSGTFLQGSTVKNWFDYVGSNATDGSGVLYYHTGWAVKLSGVTSGGVGSGGGFGGGVQSG